MTIIKEQYNDFTPPPSIRKAIERIVKTIPSQNLSGLHSIVLTNSSSLSRAQKRKKVRSGNKKYYLKECPGLYFCKRQNEPAYIQINIENILSYYPSCIRLSRFATDLILSKFLFHEIGHHINETQVTGHKDNEGAAEEWSKKLTHKYIWRKYWYVMILLLPFRGVINWLRKKK